MNVAKPATLKPFFQRKLTLRQFLTPRRVALTGVGLTALAGIALLSLSASSQPTADSADPATPLLVEVELADRVNRIRAERTFTGTMVARRVSDLGFQRSAKLLEVLVDQGDVVREGQPLARLDRRQLEIRKRQTRAMRDQAAAVLAELEAGPRVETIAAARASVEDGKAKVELQQRNLTRMRRLIDENAVSQERFDETELGLKSAKALLAVSLRQLEELEAGTRQEQLQAQRAAVAQLDAQLDDLEVDIVDSTLLAPYAGRISRRSVDEGVVVGPSQAILQLIESGALEARVGLPVDAFAELEPGQSTSVEVAGQHFPATFERALPEVDRQTRTRTAIFELDRQAADQLVPGQVARVAVSQQRSADGFWVPTAALLRSYRGLWAVYAVETDSGQSAETAETSGVVVRRDVEFLSTEGDRTFVRGTISAGEPIVVAGTHRVVPGQRVRFQQRESTNVPAPPVLAPPTHREE